MARKSMVTRTIVTTKVTVLVLDLVTCEPSTKVFELAGNLNEKAVMKSLEESMDLTKEKPVHVTSLETIEKLYGLSEDDFVKQAVELDKETRKPVETV